MVVDQLVNKDNNHIFCLQIVLLDLLIIKTMKLSALRQLDNAQASDVFKQCCSASRWIQLMVSAMPFSSKIALQNAAATFWKSMQSADYMEAFDGHPKIGDPELPKKKHSSADALAANEQSSVAQANDNVLRELVQYNNDYETKFGHIFIVCATGKTAAEMLALIKTRINNQPDREIKIAAAEQAKIMVLRIDKLIEE